MRLLKQVEIQPGCVRTDGNMIDSLCGLSLSEIYRKVCNCYPNSSRWTVCARPDS